MSFNRGMAMVCHKITSKENWPNKLPNVLDLSSDIVECGLPWDRLWNRIGLAYSDDGVALPKTRGVDVVGALAEQMSKEELIKSFLAIQFIWMGNLGESEGSR